MTRFSPFRRQEPVEMTEPEVEARLTHNVPAFTPPWTRRFTPIAPLSGYVRRTTDTDAFMHAYADCPGEARCLSIHYRPVSRYREDDPAVQHEAVTL